MFPDRATLDQWAKSLGFQEIGITDINLSDHKPHVQAWLKAGFAGEMGYLNRNLEKRLDPSLLEPKTCRVISARMDYLPAGTPTPGNTGSVRHSLHITVCARPRLPQGT